MKSLLVGMVISTIVGTIPGSSIKYVREESLEFQVIKAEVSAYTSSPEETDDTPHLTASGSTTRSGVVACPNWLEFGTKIEIAEKIYICEDRMNQRYSNQKVFDIWMPDRQLALEWGRKDLEVKIYK